MTDHMSPSAASAASCVQIAETELELAAADKEGGEEGGDEQPAPEARGRPKKRKAASQTIKKKKVKEATVTDRMSALGCSGPGALNVLRNKAFEQTGSSIGSKLQLVERLEQAQQQQQQQ